MATCTGCTEWIRPLDGRTPAQYHGSATQPLVDFGRILEINYGVLIAEPIVDPSLGRSYCTVDCMNRHVHDFKRGPLGSRHWGFRFAREVEKETKDAREKFGNALRTLDCECHIQPRSIWIEVITEELGKLARASNKLRLAKDERIRAQWSSEGRRRILTIASLTRRMAEVWPDLVEEDNV